MKKMIEVKPMVAAWAGMLGAALFVAVFSLEGLLRPGYNALSSYVSALSLGPRGWVQVTNFLVFGLLFFIFSRGLAGEFRSGKASRGGINLLTVISFCFFFSGPFVMDPGGTPINQVSVHGTIHGILGAIAFMLMPISIFVFLRRFRTDPNWAALRGWSLGLGSLSAAGLVVLSVVTKSPQFQTSFAGWFGLIQRTLIIPFMAWVFVFAFSWMQRIKSGR